MLSTNFKNNFYNNKQLYIGVAKNNSWQNKAGFNNGTCEHPTFTGNLPDDTSIKIKFKYESLQKLHLAAAESCIGSGDYLWSVIILFHAVEAALKANYISKNNTTPTLTHKLCNMATASSINLNDKEEKFLKFLEKAYFILRYPSNFEDIKTICNKSNSTKILKNTTLFLDFLKQKKLNMVERQKMEILPDFNSDRSVNRFSISEADDLQLINIHLKAAENLYLKGHYIWSTIACHQSIEKAANVMKKLKIKNTNTSQGSLNTHNLFKILRSAQVLSHKIRFENDKESLDELSKLYVNARYPEDIETLNKTLNKEKASTIIFLTKSLIGLIKNNIFPSIGTVQEVAHQI